MNALSPLLSPEDLLELDFEEEEITEETDPVVAVTRDAETGYVSVVLNDRARKALTAVLNCIDDDCLNEKYDYAWDTEQVLARLRAAL